MTDALQNFWSDAQKAPLVVLTDFDYTISQVDVGDLITDTLAPPSPATVRRFAAREIGSRLYWLDSMTRVNPTEAMALADTVGIDPFFADFVAWCAQQQIPLAVVSDGFGFYIRRVLGRYGLDHLPIFCNEMTEPGKLSFPNANPACDACACCKPLIVRRVRKAGARVIYVGDGISDIYAAAFADWVFAKGSLARFMDRNGSPYYPLDSFQSLRTELAAKLNEFAAGTAPRRATLSPSGPCRFEDEC